MGKGLSSDLLLCPVKTASKRGCMVNCLPVSIIAFVESTPNPTAEVASIPKASRCDYAVIFRHGNKVAVEPGLTGEVIFTAKPIERDDLMIEFKGDRISSSERRHRDNEYSARGWLADCMLSVRYYD